MSRRSLLGALIPAIILFACYPAMAENRLALVIGQSAYLSVPVLPNPANEAKAMTQLLTDSGFDFSLLSEYRGRLLANGAERRLFDLLLELCRKRGWIKARGKQRTDSTHVRASIRTLRRLGVASVAVYFLVRGQMLGQVDATLRDRLPVSGVTQVLVARAPGSQSGDLQGSAAAGDASPLVGADCSISNQPATGTGNSSTLTFPIPRASFRMASMSKLK